MSSIRNLNQCQSIIIVMEHEVGELREAANIAQASHVVALELVCCLASV